MHEGEETQITKIIKNDNQKCSCGGTYILQKFSREISKKLKEINQNCNWLLIKENEQSEKKVQIIQNKIKQSKQIQQNIQPKENKYFGYLEEQESKLNDLITQKETLHQEILVQNLEIFQKKLQNLKEQKELFEKKKQEKQIDEETKIKNLRNNIQEIQPRKQQLEKLIQIEPIQIENLNNQLQKDQEFKQKKVKELEQNYQNIDKLEEELKNRQLQLPLGNYEDRNNISKEIKKIEIQIDEIKYKFQQYNLHEIQREIEKLDKFYFITKCNEEKQKNIKNIVENLIEFQQLVLQFQNKKVQVKDIDQIFNLILKYLLQEMNLQKENYYTDLYKNKDLFISSFDDFITLFDDCKQKLMNSNVSEYHNLLLQQLDKMYKSQFSALQVEKKCINDNKQSTSYNIFNENFLQNSQQYQQSTIQKIKQQQQGSQQSLFNFNKNFQQTNQNGANIGQNTLFSNQNTSAQQVQNPFMQTSIKNVNQGGNNLFTLPGTNLNTLNGNQSKNNKNQQLNGRKEEQYSEDDDQDW